MAIQIKNWRWLDTNKQAIEGGSHDGSYQIFTLPNSGKAIALYNGPNGTTGTVIKFTTAADVTNFTNANGTKTK